MRVLVVGVLLCATSISCAGGERSSAPDPCPPLTPVDAVEVGELGRFPLSEFGTIVSVEERAGFVGAEAISTTQIVELYPEIVRTVTASGFTYVGGDNEGFEAELSFVDRAGRSITMALRRGSCDGQVSVRVLLERKVGA